MADNKEPKIKYPSPRSKDKKRREAGKWIVEQRKAYEEGRLSDLQIRELEALPGWRW